MTLNTPAKKSLGQYWLDDQATLEAICQAAELNKDDVVLEIGPGQGALTKLLTQKAKQVIAVELDETLASSLSSQQFANNLQVITGNILKYDLTKLPKNYKVVANIPFYLTNNLLRILCESSNPFNQAALLVQKEVAQRVTTSPGNMSILAVSVQFYCQAKLGPVVQAKLFKPVPKVDSQVLILTRRQKPIFDINSKQFFHLVKAGFANRRKTLVNSLGGGLQLDKQAVENMLSQANLSLQARAQELSLDDWYRLYKQIG